MWKVLIAVVLLTGAAATAFYQTDGKLWGLPELAGLHLKQSPRTDESSPPGTNAGGKAYASRSSNEGPRRGPGRCRRDCERRRNHLHRRHPRNRHAAIRRKSVQITSEIAGRITEIALSEGAPSKPAPQW